MPISEKEFDELAAKFKSKPAIDAEYTERLALEKTFWDEAGDAEVPAAIKSALGDNNRRIEEIELSIKDRREAEAGRKANDARRSALLTVAGTMPAYGSDDGDNAASGRARGAKSVADAVLADAAFADWRDRLFKDGRQPSHQFGNSPSVNVKALLTGLSDTSAGAMISADRYANPDITAVMRSLTLRSLLTSGRTASDLVEFVRQGTFTNAAAAVPEATTTSNAEAVKPESSFALALVSAPVKTIAHWMPATRRAIADVGQLRTLMDGLLVYGLEEKLNDQLLNGDGVGENFAGLYATAGITAQAFSTGTLETTRKARTKVRTVGRGNPTAYVMHPTDWESIDLLKDGESRYYFGGPAVIGSPRLWGLPVVEDESATVGLPIVADWRLAVLWDREDAQILVSDSHSDFFTRNLLAVLAEIRAAFGCIRPAAFVTCDITP